MSRWKIKRKKADLECKHIIHYESQPPNNVPAERIKVVKGYSGITTYYTDDEGVRHEYRSDID